MENKKCNVLRNTKSRKNRIFYDQLIMELAIEIYTGGELDAELPLFSYAGVGKCFKYSVARVGEVLSEKEIEDLRREVAQMREEPPPESLADLKRMFLAHFSGITDCHLSALNCLDFARLKRLAASGR